jgi:hypothetical protein
MFITKKFCTTAFAKAYWQCKGKGTKKSIKQKQNNKIYYA